MKKNMNKLLVIVMALMPSLSILSFAQEPGGGADTELLPVKSTPTPTNPGPRFSPNENGDGIDDGGLIDLGFGGVRPRSGHDDEIPIPIKPDPNPNPNPGHEPRIRNTVQNPYCYHSAGIVYIEADSSISYINASVTRYADNQEWSNAAGTNTLSITASPESGVYLLELTLSNGLSYIGEYTIE